MWGFESTVSNSNHPGSTHQWWKPKAGSLLHILYLVMFIGALPFARSLVLLVAALVTIAGIGIFGHLINDWCDIEVDRIAGKKNQLARFTFWQKVLAVVGALVLALLPWAILPFDRASLILLVTEFLLLIVYAAPPLRIKERIYLAVVTDAVYAYALPAVLAAHTFSLPAGKLDHLPFPLPLRPWQFLSVI